MGPGCGKPYGLGHHPCAWMGGGGWSKRDGIIGCHLWNPIGTMAFRKGTRDWKGFNLHLHSASESLACLCFLWAELDYEPDWGSRGGEACWFSFINFHFKLFYLIFKFYYGLKFIHKVMMDFLKDSHASMPLQFVLAHPPSPTSLIHLLLVLSCSRSYMPIAPSATHCTQSKKRGMGGSGRVKARAALSRNAGKKW